MTDDKEEKTLEQQEHFVEVAKSRDVEVLEAKPQYLEFAGNLVPVTKSGEQLALTFRAFRENRLPFTVRVKDHHADAIGRIAFMREARVIFTFHLILWLYGSGQVNTNQMLVTYLMNSGCQRRTTTNSNLQP